MSDPMILSWGAGVNICEDLRRSIRTEIDDSIDPSIMNLHGNVKNEDRTSTQLAKDLSHARAEMLELRRSADDELDGAKMKDQVRTRLKATLKAELMTPMIDVNSSPDTSEESDNMDGSLPSTISAYLKQRASELKERASKAVVERESLVQIRATRDALEGETQSVLGRIESDRLLDQVAAEKKEVALHSEEFENETRRKRSTKGAVQQKRAECGQHAQQIADRVSTYIEPCICESSFSLICLCCFSRRRKLSRRKRPRMRPNRRRRRSVSSKPRIVFVLRTLLRRWLRSLNLFLVSLQR